MGKFFITYGTTEGHTHKVATHIAQAIRAQGFTADVHDCTDPKAMIETPYDGFIVGSSVHVGKHQEAITEFVRRNRRLLESAPSVFFSVGLASISSRPEQQAAAQQNVDTFLEETGWDPDHTWLVAGALRYSRYGFLKRMLMKRIARREGYSTDTSQDHEYTDWAELDRLVESFLADSAGFYAATSSLSHPA